MTVRLIMKTYNQTVLITGGATYLNIELAELFIKHQNHVILIDSNIDNLLMLQDRLPSLHTAAFDLQNELQLNQLEHYLAQHFPSISLVINCISNVMMHRDPSEHSPYFCTQQQLENNFANIMSLNTNLLPLLQKHGDSAIMNLSIHTTSVPNALSPVYFNAYRALINFSHHLENLQNYNPNKVRVFSFYASHIYDRNRPNKECLISRMNTTILSKKVLLAFEHNLYDQRIGLWSHLTYNFQRIHDHVYHCLLRMLRLKQS